MEYNVERWVLDRAPGSAKTRTGTGTAATGASGLRAVAATRGGKRPTSSPTSLIPNRPSPETGDNSGAEDSSNTKDAITNNGDGTGNKDGDKPSLRKLSAYIRTIKPSSHPELAESPNDGSSPGKQDQQAVSGEGRRESGVALAAKRVARRKRQEKADEEVRKKV